MVVSAERGKELGLEPMARVVAAADASVIAWRTRRFRSATSSSNTSSLLAKYR